MVKIAATHATTMAALTAANNATTASPLYPGNVLCLPTGAATNSTVATTVPSTPTTPVTIQQFPVQGQCYFSDTYGAPRSGGRSHEGVDIIAKAGLYLYAVTDGTLTKQYIDAPGALAGNGWRLTRPDGTYFFYAHLSAFAPGLKVGSVVKAGQILGNVGMTGNAGTPHLHFEVHPRGGSSVNPTAIVKAVDGCKTTVVPPQPGGTTPTTPTTVPATTPTTSPGGTAAPTTTPVTSPSTTGPVTSVPASSADKWQFVVAVKAFDSAGSKLAPAAVKKVKVAGLAGVPAGTPGVMLRVVPRNVSAAGYLTVFPCDAAAPAVSTLNFSPGRINATTTVVKVVNGEVCVSANVATDLRIDVIGVLGTTGVGVQPIVAKRAMDTRTSSPLAANGTKAATITALGIPAGSKAVTLTITLLNPVAAGSIGVGPCGGTPWILPFAAVPAQVFSGVIRTNDAGICVSSTAAVHVVLDATAAWTGSKVMTPAAPTRLFDSRSSGLITSTGRTVTLALPAGAARAQVSVTIIGRTPGAALLVWNCADKKPTASVVYTPATVISSTTVTLNVTGASICLASTANVHAVIDLVAIG